MNRLFLAFLAVSLFFGGCDTVSVSHSNSVFVVFDRTYFPNQQSQEFLMGNTVVPFMQRHPDINIIVAFDVERQQDPPPDIFVTKAASLPQLVSRGGLEPLQARLDAKWLEGFDKEALTQCYVADVLFAIPWLVAGKLEDSLFITGYAMSTHKDQAVAFMKFLASDKQSLLKVSKATGLRPARQL